MSEFYKMDPAKWDFGTAELSLEEEAAYLRIVNAMHKHCAPVPDNDRVIAGMFRVSTRKARSLVTALVKAGKLQIEGGFITNERAISDLNSRGVLSNTRAEMGAKGGKARAEKQAALAQTSEASQSVRDQFVTISTLENVTNGKRTVSETPPKPLINNDQGQAIASSREEKRREEKNIVGFDEFWAAFPKRKNMPGKEKVRPKFEAALKQIQFDDLMTAVRAYADSRANAIRKDGEQAQQYTKCADAWLNGGFYQSWLGEAPADITAKNKQQEADLLAKTGGKKPAWMAA